MGGVLLSILSLAGHELAQHATGHMQPAVPVRSLVPYGQIPALLAQARIHNPTLNLPHAHWFIRVRHGHEWVVVDDRTLPHGGSSNVGTGRGQ